MEEVNAQELLSTIYVVAVSNNQESSTSLLNTVFSGLQTTDSQEWTTKIGNINVKCYIKYPDCDIHRRTPNFADVAIAGVGAGDKEELDVLNYLSSRKDARHRLLVDTDTSRAVDSHIQVLNASETYETIKKYTEELAGAVAEFGEGHEEADRREFAQGNKEGAKLLKKWIRSVKDIKTMVSAFEKTITDFAVETTKWQSENKGKFDFSPEKGESNGVGASVELISGDEFTAQNPNLPITVRDNLLTATLELYAKDPNNAQEIITSLENAKQMAGQFGLLAELDKVGISVTFSKDGSSVFVDFTIGGILGEGLINRIRRLNLERFKLSLKDSFKIMTNINLTDLWKTPDLKKVVQEGTKLSVVGEGQLLNIRGLLHLIREIGKVVPQDKNKKAANMISYGLLILSTFENFGIEIKYDSDELYKVGFEIAAAIMEAQSTDVEGMLEGFTSTLKDAILPMALSQIEAIKPMLEPFAEGLKSVNFDKISAEIVIPSVRTELKLNIMLPGLTEFLGTNVLN